MNVCVRNTFIILWLLLAAKTLSAQGPCFYFPFLNNAVPGSFKLMPLRVVNLDSVVSMQMVFRWNPQVLQFVNVEQFNFSDLNQGDFNTLNAVDSGYVRLLWEGNSDPPGFSAPDSSAIFRFRFKVIGPDTSSTQVRVTELLTFPSTIYEVIKVRPNGSNEDYLIDELCQTPGFVAVGFTVDADEPFVDELPVTLTPNPFSSQARLQFELFETDDVQVLIADATGKIIFQKNILNAAPGQHGMVIEKEMIGASGAYSLMLRAGRKTATRTFVLH